jgi:hypothetical protein
VCGGEGHSLVQFDVHFSLRAPDRRGAQVELISTMGDSLPQKLWVCKGYL